MRPANRVLNVNTCSPVFRLPDGTTSGTSIPFGKRWNGYERVTLEGLRFGWQRSFAADGKDEGHTRSGQRRVECVWLERVG